MPVVIAYLSFHMRSMSFLSMSNSIVFTSAGIANEMNPKPQALYPVGLVYVFFCIDK